MKMKNISFILLFLSVFTAISGQTSGGIPQGTKTNKYMLEFSSGYSVALGNYASVDRNNKKAGYAGNGWLAQLTFDWIGKKNFGVAIQYTFQQNNLKSAADAIIPDGMNFTLGSGSWSNNFLMLGPVFMKTIKKVRINAKMLAGFMVSSSTNFNTRGPADTISGQHEINPGTGFAYEISTGIGYCVSPHVVFKFDLSLLGGWPGINKRYSSQLVGGNWVQDPKTGTWYFEPIYNAPFEFNIKKVVTTLNPSIGLVYCF